jgi:polysaccharide transporter, PST family
LEVFRLLKYSAAMLVTVTAVPVALISMRAEIGTVYGWDKVGQWQAVSRIGDAYTQIFGVWFVSILLPKLSKANVNNSKSEMLSLLVPIVSIFATGSLIFWYFSHTILTLAYSENFTSSDNYILAQLIADFFKLLSSFLIYRFMAIGQPLVQVGCEISQAVVMYGIFHALFSFGSEAAIQYSFIAGALASLAFALAKTYISNQSNKFGM